MSAKISLYRGVTYPSTYNHTDGSGNKLALTGCQVLFTIKPVSYDDDPTDATAIFKTTATITDAINGVATFNVLIPATTVEPGNYFYDIVVVDTSGKALPPVLDDKCVIKGKVTNRNS